MSADIIYKNNNKITFEDKGSFPFLFFLKIKKYFLEMNKVHIQI
jgi:hypothetical protein